MSFSSNPVVLSLKSASMNSFIVLALFFASVGSQTEAFGEFGASDVYIVRLKGSSAQTLASQPAYFVDNNGNVDHQSKLRVKSHMSALSLSHDEFLATMLETGTYEKLYSYTYLLNALAVRLDSNVQAKLLQSHPSVVSIENDVFFTKLTTHTPSFLGLPYGPWMTNGGKDNAGEDIVIGILDTGIYPDHKSFSSVTSKPFKHLPHWEGKCEVSSTFPEGSCNGKIVGARYFARGIVAANVFNASNDFDSPLDGDGHGTHTSSISAGNHGIPVNVNGYKYGHASGMAPRARLAIYKVIFRDGGYLSDVLAGIDQAVEDGVHILSISLGATSGAYGVPFLNSFDVMMLRAVKSGVLVVHAAGNNGPSPFTMNSFGPWLLSVSASFTDRSYENSLRLGNGVQIAGAGLTAGTQGKMYPLIYSEDAYNSDPSIDSAYYSYCPDPSPFNKTLVKGKILICNFVEYFSGGAVAQISNAVQTATSIGAAGLLVLAQAADRVKSKTTISDPFPFTIPATFVQDANASSAILEYYHASTTRNEKGGVKLFGAHARIKDSRNASYTLTAPKVASYSSRGPVYADTVSSLVADIIKPDVLAPGHQIWGAWVPEGIEGNAYNGYRFAMVSGTSMAAPHIAGIAALIRQKYPNWSPSAIRSAILTTASQLDNREKLIRAEQPSVNASLSMGRASPFDYGSGAVNAKGAMDPGLVFDADFQDYVNFVCLVPGADENSVQYSTGAPCGNVAGAWTSDLNMPYIAVANLLGERVMPRTVKNVALRREEYNVTVRHPQGVQVFVKPKSLVLKPGEKATFHVTLHATQANQAFTFGYLVWTGNRGHVVRMPIVVSANSVNS